VAVVIGEAVIVVAVGCCTPDPDLEAEDQIQRRAEVALYWWLLGHVVQPAEPPPMPRV
jgi:hypothetical protein